MKFTRLAFTIPTGTVWGDLNGITQKIPYLAELGVNTVWVHPFYQSPFKDGGYDITDYYAVDKRFGNKERHRRRFGNNDKSLINKGVE